MYWSPESLTTADDFDVVGFVCGADGKAMTLMKTINK